MWTNVGWGVIEGGVGAALVARGGWQLERWLPSEAILYRQVPWWVLVPLGVGLGGLWGWWSHMQLTGAITLGWMVLLLGIAWFDVRRRLVLDVVIYGGVLVAILLAGVRGDLLTTIIGGLVAGGILLPMAIYSEIVSKGTIFGWGDVKLAILIGVVVGMGNGPGNYYALYAVIIGVMLGGAFIVLGLALRLISWRSTIAYGPFLALGGILELFLR